MVETNEKYYKKKDDFHAQRAHDAAEGAVLPGGLQQVDEAAGVQFRQGAAGRSPVVEAKPDTEAAFWAENGPEKKIGGRGRGGGGYAGARPSQLVEGKTETDGNNYS